MTTATDVTGHRGSVITKLYNTWIADWLNFQLLLSAVIIIATAIVSIVLFTPYEMQIIIVTIVFAIMGVGWGLAGGLAGQLLMGYCTFFGIGAYTNGILLTHFGISPWINLVLGGVFAGLAAMLFARISMRFGLKDDYFGLFTVAVSQVFMVIFYNWDLAGRAVGISISIREYDFWGMSFPDKTGYLFTGLGILAVVLLISYCVQKSRFGYYLAAVRESSTAAEAVGINVTRVKILVIGLSSGIAGTCGAFFSMFTTFIDPQKVFGLAQNFEFLLGPVLGGRLSLIGGLLGASILRPVKDIMRGYFGGEADALYLVLYGLILVFAILLMPRGIAGLLEPFHARYLGHGKRTNDQ